VALAVAPVDALAVAAGVGVAADARLGSAVSTLLVAGPAVIGAAAGAAQLVIRRASRTPRICRR